MEYQITEGENFLLNINIDFDQLLDENFNLICKAIQRRSRILAELSQLMSKNKDVAIKAIKIIRMSEKETDAAINLEEQLGISQGLSKYILKLPLSKLSSLNSVTANAMLKEYKDFFYNISL